MNYSTESVGIFSRALLCALADPAEIAHVNQVKKPKQGEEPCLECCLYLLFL